MNRHPVLTKKLIHLNVTLVRPVSWPAGGHVVAFTVTGAASRLAVRKILHDVFSENALIRRFCTQRQSGEFSLFASALPPAVGTSLAVAIDPHQGSRAGHKAGSRGGGRE